MKYFSIFNIFKKIKSKTFIDNSYIQELISKDVIIKDINSTYIDRSVKIGSGTVVMPSTFILGDTEIGSNCLLGPNSTISNSQISDQVEIVYSIVLDSSIDKKSKIGPFTFIREESRIGEKVEIGNFVEIKSSQIAENTKSKHLAYLGDLSIDKNVISIDGDGSVLMNMNTLATIGNRAPSNYTLLIVDNGSYGSTGDQKTFTDEKTSLKDVALGAGCKKVIECSGEETLENLNKAIDDKDHSYVVISKIKSGNVPVNPILLNPITIRDRFRKAIGLVSYL